MSVFLEKIASRGYKITPPRRLILKVMEEKKVPLTAEDIAREIKKERPEISLATVYRNLNLLVEMDLVNKFHGGGEAALYQLSWEHEHYMICLICGKVINLTFCPLKEEINDVALQYDFMIKSHYFQINGYCGACKQKSGIGG
ncbi:Fur family transcriptional regulator, ferric uptake regulator [Thermosyntropha lipolytica DSM 11003]|uniref:Fur family transcriptional regulator, ferric uptake regulator n=1 Tax=Thermosyntropha lipolytica DSM 11003 TaxID=1123382 RepID=A0A1M5JGR8_9FIRM|nr:transcriptional repressor [Thermosyntropha lipolytica]SHG39708.1 Fur family transcriptional regulator, ferric uptake regulator [Thermosyntropha lipolytica DSM 11003]